VEAVLLPLLGFVFVSLVVAVVAMSMSQGATATIERRLGELRNPGVPPPPTSSYNESFVKTFKRLGQAAPRSAGELSKLRQRLLAFVALSSGIFGRSSLLLGLTGAAAGYLIPSFVLARMAKARQHRIRLSLPDALDLLVVSVEAGLGLDQALQRVGEELALAHPELSEELRLVNLELRAGKARSEALRNLADRTGVDDLSSLVAMLIQTDKFGTSVARSLRVHSDVLRSKRRQRAEEAAAKTGVKMVFPLVFCIFPAIWVVTIGPAAIKFVEVLFPLANNR
jgi:pilus assembly protein TadC